MKELRQEYVAEGLSYRAYSYFMPQDETSAPLVAPGSGDFRAIGFWLQIPNGTMSGQRMETAIQIEAAFGKLVQAKGYRRYIQAELTGGVEAYHMFWGDELYQEFRERKQELDPHHLFGRNNVFSYP